MSLQVGSVLVIHRGVLKDFTQKLKLKIQCAGGEKMGSIHVELLKVLGCV